MKLSNTAGLLSNKPVYALIAIYMPMIMLLSFVFLLRELLLQWVTFESVFPIASGFITALAATLYCDFMKDSKSSRIAANARGGIIVFFVSYLLSSVLLNIGSPFSRIFIPNLHNTSSSFAALYAWDSVISLKQLFSARKLFDKYTELYRGEKLQEALFGDHSLLRYNGEEIVRIKKGYTFQLILAGLLLLINAVLGISMSLTLYLLLILVLESVVCFYGFIEIFRREHYYAGGGMVLPPFDRIRRIFGIGIFSALCTILAIFLTSDKSILQFSQIIDFLKWLAEFFRRPLRSKIEIDLKDIQFQPPPPVDIEQAIPGFVEKKSEPFKIWIWLQYAFVAFAALVFLWFMISPIFNRGKGLKKFTFRQRLIRIIKESFKGALSALLSLISFIRNGRTSQKIHRQSAEDISRTAETLLGIYLPAKKRDIRHSATLFAQLIIWGSDVRQITWKPSHAPGEYCGLLAAAARAAIDAQLHDLPSSTDGDTSSAAGCSAGTDISNHVPASVIRCGEIFEKALYSVEVLSDKERKEFKELVESIISSN